MRAQAAAILFNLVQCWGLAVEGSVSCETSFYDTQALPTHWKLKSPSISKSPTLNVLHCPGANMM